MDHKIENQIGDALVERIIRAHENDEDWRAVIIIPLLPGFEASVADQEGTSVRLISQCQYRSISRGEKSIFGRLRKAGIEPDDYIQFFSLRQWGKINNQQVLTTEQLYIHAKIIIADDRVALIGSANINERSMLGDRDSECAAIVRDKDMIWSTMAGKPYQVGRFAHTLRLRLMREHLGLDVDEIMEEERQAEASFEDEMDQIYSDESEATPVAESSKRGEKSQTLDLPYRAARAHSANYDVDLRSDSSESSESERPTSGDSKGKAVQETSDKITGRQKDVQGYGNDHWKSAEQKGTDQGRDSTIVDGHEFLLHNTQGAEKDVRSPRKVSTDYRKSLDITSNTSGAEGNENAQLPPMPQLNRRSTDQLGLLRANQLPNLPQTDDTDIGGPPLNLDHEGKPFATPVNPLMAEIKLAHITKDCMRDPINPSFYDNIWSRVAANNTKLYRRVFRCMPDSEATNWHEFQEFANYGARFQESMESPMPGGTTDEKAAAHDGQATSGAAGIGAPSPAAALNAVVEKVMSPGLIQSPNQVNTADGGEAMNEKQGLPRQPSRKASKESKPDMEKAAEAEHALKDHREVTVEEASEATDSFPALPPGIASPALERNKDRRTTFSNLEKAATTSSTANQTNVGSMKRRRRATTKSSRRGFHSFPEEVLSKAEAEQLCNMIQGHLVEFPHDWLWKEESNGNWLYQVDQMAPLSI